MAARYWVGGSGDWNSTARWSATSGGASGASVPTTSDNVIFDSNSSPSNADFTVSFPNGLAASTTSVEVYTANALLTFDFSPGGTLTCTGLTISATTTADGLRLIDSTTTRSALYCTGTTTLTQGLLNLNGYRMTSIYFSSTNSNTRSIAFGSTGSILLPGINASTTVWNTSTDTNLTLSGSKNVVLEGFNVTTTRTLTVSLSTNTTVSNLFNFNIGTIVYNTSNLTYMQYNFSSPSGTPTMDSLVVNAGNVNSFIVGSMTIYGTATVTTGSISGSPNIVGTLTMTGGSISGNPTVQSSVSITGASVSGVLYVYGNINIGASSSIGTLYPTSTQATQTLTATSNLTNLTIDKASGSVVLQQATTVTGTTTVTSGTFNLNNYLLTTTYFFSTNSNTRSIAFGTGSILLPGINSSTTVWNTSTDTNLTLSGSKNVTLQGFNVTTTRTITVSLSTNATRANLFNFTVGDVVYNTSNLTYMQYNFSSPGGTATMDSFTVNISDNRAVSVGNFILYGNLTSTSSYNSGTIYFYGTENQTITQTNGSILSLDINKSSGTVSLSTNVTVAFGYSLTLNAGTLSLGSFTLTTSYFFSNNSNVRTIAFGTGTIVLSGINTTGTTTWNTSTDTNLTLTGSRNVSLQANFNPGSSTRTNIISLSTNTSLIYNFTIENVFYNTSNLTYIQYNFSTPSGTASVNNFTMNVSRNEIFAVGTMNHYGTTTLTLGSLSGNPNFFGVLNINGGVMSGTAYIYNNFSITSGAITVAYFTGTQATQTFTTSIALPTVTIDKSSGSVVLQQATTITTTTLTSSTLNLNGFTLTTTYFFSSNSNTRSIAFGSTGSILLPGINSSTTVWNTSTDTNLTLSGSKNVTLQGFNVTTTRTLTVSLSTNTTLANIFNFNIGTIVYNTSNLTYMQYNFSSPSGTPTMDTLVVNAGNVNSFIVGSMIVYNTTTVTSGSISGSPTFVNSLTMTGGTISGNPTAQTTASLSNSSVSGTLYVYGNINIGTNSSVTTLYPTSTQATQTLTATSNLTNLTIDKASGSVVLQQATTVTGTTTVTSGTFNLNNYLLTTTYFFSTNSNTRSIAFGSTGSILLPGINASTTVWNTSTDTNLTLSGSKNVTLQGFNVTTTRTLTVSLSTNATRANLFNFTVGDVFWNTSNLTYMQYNFSSPGGTATMDSFTVNISNANAVTVGNFILYGNLTSTSSYNSGTIYFYGTENQTITQTNGSILSLDINKSSGTVSLSTNVTVAFNYSLTLNAGTLSLGSFTLTTSYFFSSNSNTRTIAFGTGRIVLSGINTTGTTTWNTSTDTGLTITGSKNVSLQANFNPGSSTRTNTISLSNTTDIAKLYNFTVENVFYNTSNLTYIQYNFSTPSGTASVNNFTMNVSRNEIFAVGTMNHYGTTTLTLGSLSGNPNFYGVLNINGGVMSGTAYIYNNFSITSGAITVAYFLGTQVTQTFVTNIALPTVTIDKSSGSVVLQQATTITTTTLTSGTLNLNNYTLTTTYFFSSNSNTRSIAFGSTGSILLPGINASTTVWNTSTDTNLTLSGSKNVTLQGFNVTTTRTLTVSLSTNTTLANIFNFNIGTIVYNTSNLTYIQYNFSSPSGTPTMDTLVVNAGNVNSFIVGSMIVYNTTTVTSGSISGSPTLIGNLTMTGGSISGNPTVQSNVSMTNAFISGTLYVYGNINISTGCSITTLYPTSTQATQTLTTASNLTNLTIDKASGSVVLQQATTVTGTTTVTSGTFNINGYLITTTYFFSSNSNTRSIAFGSTGSILLPGINSSTTVWNTSTDTNLTLSGSKNVTLQGFNVTTTRTITVSLSTNATRANLFNFTVGDVVYNTSNLTYMQYNFSSPSGTATMDSFTVNISDNRAVSVGNFILYGNLTSTSSYNSGTIYFYGTENQTITQQAAGIILSLDINKSSGTVTLLTNTTISSGYSVTLNAGTLSLGSFTLSTPYFFSNNSNIRTIAFGTGRIVLSGVNTNTTVWTTATDTGLTITGSKNVSLQANFNPGSSTRTNTISLSNTTDIAKLYNFTVENVFYNTSNLTYVQYNFSSPSGTASVDTFTMNVSTNSVAAVGTMNHYGTTTLTLGTLSGNPNFYGVLNINGGVMSGTAYIYNNFSITSGSISVPYFTGTQATQTLTTLVTLPSTTVDKSSGSVVLQQATTISGTFTLTSGTLNLNDYTLTTTVFNSTNSNSRSIAFGTIGSILLPGINSSTTIWNTSTDTNLTLSGSKNVILQGFNVTTTRSITISLSTSTNVANLFNFNINNVFYNTSNLTYMQYVFSSPGGTPAVDNLEINTGNNSVNVNLNTLYVCGNLFSDSGNPSGSIYMIGGKYQYMRASGSFAATMFISKDVNTTVELNGAFTTSSYVSLTQGIFSLYFYTMTSTYFTSSNTNTRSVVLGSGTWNLTSTGTIWDMATSTNATVTSCGNGTIALTNQSTTARTFNGGNLSYGNLVIGGAGGTSTTTITGSNNFKVISATKTVAHTLTFTAGTTTSFRELTITGTPSYTVTINSTSSTRAVLIKNSIWEVGANSTNGGNNVGLTFTTSTTNPINYLSFANIEGQYVPFVGSAKTQFLAFYF